VFVVGHHSPECAGVDSLGRSWIVQISARLAITTQRWQRRSLRRPASATRQVII